MFITCIHYLVMKISSTFCVYKKGLIGSHLALVVQTSDSAIHWINLYPVDHASVFPNIYLSAG